MRLFAHLQLEDREAVSTQDLTQSFGWQSNQLGQQHDVAELNRILIDAIGRSLKGTSAASLVSNLFGYKHIYCVHDLFSEKETFRFMMHFFFFRIFSGSISNIIQCSECGYRSQRLEEFIDVTIQTEGFGSLLQSLDNYVQVEHMSGANQYRCSGCNNKVDAQKRACFGSLPPILTFSFMRFRFDWKKGVREKLHDRFEFPRVLNMSPYLDASTSSSAAPAAAPHQLSEDDCQYELMSVIIHKGKGAQAGHYHAFIRDVMRSGHWSSELARMPDPAASKKGPSLTTIHLYPLSHQIYRRLFVC
jgi:ubiquitin C-terminal hydrolase